MATVDMGALSVRYEADISKLESELKRLDKRLSDTDKAAEKSATLVGRQVGVVVNRLILAVSALVSVRAAIQAFMQALADISAMDRLSQATGLTIEQLSSLRTVAEQNGVRFNELSQVISQFGNRLRESVANHLSPMNQALRLLGVSARDSEGNLRTFDQMLPQLADAFARYADGANKSALAAALFGEQGGPAMVRFLNQGSTAIASQRQELERTGNVVTRDGVDKARAYEKAMTELNAALTTLSRDFALMLAPSITSAFCWVSSSARLSPFRSAT